MSDCKRVPVTRSRIAALTLLLPVALILTACEDSDPTAPDGSTITISADPQTTQPNVSSKITATVRSGSGTRLPDQEVIFSTSQGSLTPPAQTPLISDDNGQVTSTLRTPSTATVTATSGTISATTSVSIISCNLQNLLINVVPQILTSCNGSATVTVTAIDDTGAGCGGVSIAFFADPPGSGLTELPGSLNPQQVVTDANGEATSTFNVDSSACQNSCANPNPGQCEVDLSAEDNNGNYVTPVVVLSENVP